MNNTLRQTYWQLTALLLCAQMAGWAPGLGLALLLNAVQALHFLLWHRSTRVLEVQVRIFYFGLMAMAATVPALNWVIALQFAGLTARLCTDYCLAARLLVLMPWNRAESLSLSMVRRVLLMPPSPGPIQARLVAMR